MVQVLRISQEGQPTPYSNHVMVTPTSEGPVMAFGATNGRGAVCYYVPPMFLDVEIALTAAARWAAAHGIEIVHLLDNGIERATQG